MWSQDWNLSFSFGAEACVLDQRPNMPSTEASLKVRIESGF